MEESTQPLCTNGEEEHENDFYEKIEAPKYVDLTAPDWFQPGEDRYWFCSRAGCDQKHEEELDPETVYKNFVLRVMAARSPNIRLRKALYRKDSSAEKKCPQTVPPKPSKPRISRLALMSSMSKRVVDPKLKLKPPSKQKATPTVKAKPSSVAVKALTTPRDRKRLPNHEGFQSVRNQKATAVAVPKNRVVAKALFLSPKKSARVKTSSELNTPVKTLCAGMKKLEISDGRKPASGCNKRLPSVASRKQPRAREVKSRVYDGLLPPNGKGQNARSDKCLKKKKNKEKDMQKNSDLVPPEEVKNDARGTGIEETSRKDSLKVCFASTCDERNVHEGLLELGESKVETSPNHSRNDLHSLKRNPAVSDHAKSSQTPGRESDETNDKIKEEIKSSSEDTNELLESDGKENDCEAMESDDKENASAFDDNRKLNLDTDHPQRKILGKQHTTPKGTLKMSRALGKQSRDYCASGNQGVKQVKPKATNPKPFRLRTDERRILKEANLEKKLHLTPLKEVTSVPGLPRESLRKRHQITSQRKEKFLEQTKYEGKEKKGINRMKRAQPPIDSSTLKMAKERVGRKFSTVPQRHTVSSQQKLVTPRQENNLDNGAKRSQRRTKSPHVRQISRQQDMYWCRAAPVTADMVSVVIPVQLSVIKESPPAISRPIEPAETSEVDAVPQ